MICPAAPADTEGLPSVDLPVEAEIAAAEAEFTQATRVIRMQFIRDMQPHQEALDAKIDAIYKKYGIP